MIDGLGYAVMAISVLVGLGLLLLAVLDRRPLDRIAAGLLLVEGAALVQVLVCIVQAVRGERPTQTATFIGYALTSLLVPPAGALWALSEKTKWGTAAAGISALVLAVLTLRMRQVWG